jgi:hypothetical protein
LAKTNSQTSITLNPIKTRLYNFLSKAYIVAPERIIWPTYIQFEALELLYKHEYSKTLFAYKYNKKQ